MSIVAGQSGNGQIMSFQGKLAFTRGATAKDLGLTVMLVLLCAFASLAQAEEEEQEKEKYVRVTLQDDKEKKGTLKQIMDDSLVVHFTDVGKVTLPFGEVKKVEYRRTRGNRRRNALIGLAIGFGFSVFLATLSDDDDILNDQVLILGGTVMFGGIGAGIGAAIGTPDQWDIIPIPPPAD